MKKLIALALCAVMFAAMLTVSASAAGSILFSDNFNSGVFNDLDWRVEGSLFELQNGGPTKSGHLEGWAEAVVQQTSYGENAPAPRVYGPSFAVKCDTWFYDDGGNGVDTHWVGLWWADHFEDVIGGDRIVYTVRCIYETRTVAIIVHGENGGSEYFDGDITLAEWQLPDDEPLEMDNGEPTVFSLGMRINGTKIEGFFNDKKVVSATAPIIHQNKCPLIFWNGGCWTGFDNWVVSTVDYDLFNESADQGNNDPANNEPAETETEKRIETKVVHETNEAGEDVTVIVTEEVVVPVANTGRTNTGTRSSSKTGDTAIIVVAVMIVSIGAALIIKKVTNR